MMMDKNDTSTETLILIDWDWTQYGFRAFDLAYHMYYASFVRIFNFGSKDYDPDFSQMSNLMIISCPTKKLKYSCSIIWNIREKPEPLLKKSQLNSTFIQLISHSVSFR